MPTRELTVQQLVDDNREVLQMEWIAGRSGALRVISSNDVFRPGLALSGYFESFPWDRVQIVSKTEFSYLDSLNEEECREAITRLFSYDIPVLIFANDSRPNEFITGHADERSIPLLCSPQTSTVVTHLLSEYLDDWFAPTTVLHGTLVDVYGVGLLLTGKSGVGKSEIALDLIERGHRLVADDVVTLTRTARGVLNGAGNELLTHHMEIRGIGIIDIQGMFGIQCIRLRKRVEVEVVLKHWDEVDEVDRLGMEERMTEIMGVTIPQVILPIVPGKNITVLAETIAMNHLMKISGQNAAQSLNERLIERMERKIQARQKLGEDYE
jgi:HPr kinase/phosphorylase